MSLICIVDDDPDVRELVEYKLVQNGHEVLSATNGRDALRLVPDTKPALLLLDVMMPGLSGFDVLSQLRADPATTHLPIIMLTAKAQDADAERGFALGASDYMVKPFSPRELLNRINAQLMLVG
ncbi:MAG: two-component system, OmpR family, alkaline phosphatase synthesis response regulator PhoP [Actinomycetota bacterium]|jgi:DNA-binding response OmpR family regulator|nr:two-component system, OmpR family, alkaline phosphatase synthesis response regulator PhoP [Actinomycetota bacterium]